MKWKKPFASNEWEKAHPILCSTVFQPSGDRAAKDHRTLCRQQDVRSKITSLWRWSPTQQPPSISSETNGFQATNRKKHNQYRAGAPHFTYDTMITWTGFKFERGFGFKLQMAMTTTNTTCHSHTQQPIPRHAPTHNNQHVFSYEVSSYIFKNVSIFTLLT